MVANDSGGFERTGYGVHTVNGHDQVMFGLDHAGTTGEGLVLSILDAGPGKRMAGMTMWNGDRGLYLGTGDGAGIDYPGVDGPFHGLLIGEGKDVKIQAEFHERTAKE